MLGLKLSSESLSATTESFFFCLQRGFTVIKNSVCNNVLCINYTHTRNNVIIRTFVRNPRKGRTSPDCHPNPRCSYCNSFSSLCSRLIKLILREISSYLFLSMMFTMKEKRKVPVALRDTRCCGSGEILPKSISSLSSELFFSFLTSFLIGLNCNVVCFIPACDNK